MCLIIVASKPSQVLDLDIWKAWNTNSHGAGIMQHRTGRLFVKKGIMRFSLLEETLKKLPECGPVAVHLRMATHGAVHGKNTHPWVIDSQSALMHNGVLSGLGKHGATGESDSAHLARILSYLPHNERKSLLNTLDGRYVYSSDEGMLMHGTGWTERSKGLWLSNTYWDYSVRTRTPTYSEWEEEHPVTYGRGGHGWGPTKLLTDDRDRAFNDEDKKNGTWGGVIKKSRHSPLTGSDASNELEAKITRMLKEAQAELDKEERKQSDTPEDGPVEVGELVKASVDDGAETQDPTASTGLISQSTPPPDTLNRTIYVDGKPSRWVHNEEKGDWELRPVN